MRFRWVPCAWVLSLGNACSEPEPAEVFVLPPTVGLALEATEDGFEAVFDLANPNGFPIAVDALFVGVDVGGESDARCLPLTGGACDGAAPDWPDGGALIEADAALDAVALPERETVSCHPAIEDCIAADGMWCCEAGTRCQPLGDCFGRVIPDGSRCLICPVHVEVRVPLTLPATPETSRGAARFSGGDLGEVLIVAP